MSGRGSKMGLGLWLGLVLAAELGPQREPPPSREDRTGRSPAMPTGVESGLVLGLGFKQEP